jgi:hypothetical protein
MATAASSLEIAFGELARRPDDALQRESEKLGLLVANGPEAIDAPTPSPEAVEIAYTLAGLSLPPLREAIEAHAGRAHALGGRWQLIPPETDRLPEQTTYGIPLLAACSPDAVPPQHNALTFAARWLTARAHKRLVQMRPEFAALLTLLLAVEHALWDLTAAHGDPANRIPCAFRLRALTWFWTPDAHAPDLSACTLCIRCGDFIPPTRLGRPRTESPPFCAHCVKDRKEWPHWPKQAVAPESRGKWWLECATCHTFFVGSGQARRCGRCKSSATTRSRR